ncbi:hypothetical protein CPB84DRAFT_1758818 [Gymnopilus junonius]|uniref:Uncharacterized protein n=1 Tax=Gymnopilus junonius TaxID=109634 RepID=A0A9P5TUJ1_GYMJU|nr:hypothetical protein CPB84DRAFT_1758818 [Gymnopilus junonius]
MDHFPRQEMYSYGFKEGQPWGDDRRGLESALREMDQLERELHENYVYGRPAYNTAPGPWLSASASRHYWGRHSSRGFQPSRPPYPQAVFCMNRSDDSNSQFSPDLSMAPWPDRVSGYEHGWLYRDFSGPSGHFNAQSGRQGRSINDSMPESLPPASDRQPRRNNSPQISINYLHPDPQSQGGEAVGHSLQSRSPLNAPLSPSRMQLVTYGADRDFPRRGDQADADCHDLSPRPPTSSNGFLSGWSIATTRDTSSEIYSMDSFQSSRSVDSTSYTDTASWSSGYAESYDVRSQKEPHYRDYREHDSDESESDQDFMSDGVASDEGVYNSSSEAPEYDYEGDEIYSDGGYSSFSEGGENYDDSE